LRAIFPIIAIVAVVIMAMSFMFPEVLRGASDNGALPALVQCLMVAILVGTGLFGRSDENRIGLATGIKYAAIWLGIALFLVAGYSQRAAFAQLWGNITGEIVPSYAKSDGDVVVLRKSSDGHFWAQVELNGKSIRMMVDTGASSIALDPEDAQRAGIDLDTLNFNVPTMTANGPSTDAVVSFETIRVGDITLVKNTVSVMKARGGVSLLGMDFLGRLSSVKVEGDTMTLVK
jgi:aspartyl protease family protein